MFSHTNSSDYNHLTQTNAFTNPPNGGGLTSPQPQHTDGSGLTSDQPEFILLSPKNQYYSLHTMSKNIHNKYVFKNRTDVPWSEFLNYLDNYNYTVNESEKNGHCFISSMCKCPLFDHGEMYLDQNIQDLITSEITLNKVYYNWYYDGDIKDMLTNLESYIMEGIFTHQIVDTVILAAAKALSVNMYIYKNNAN